MKRQDVREIDTWVRCDYDYNILFEGSYEETLNFETNIIGMFLSKKMYTQFKERHNNPLLNT